VAARSWGKRGREVRGFYCAPYFGKRWHEAAGPRRPAEAGGDGGGGGTAAQRRRHAAARVVEGVVGDVKGPFYRQGEAQGRGRGGGVRRARGRALMAAGPAVALEATLGGGA